uniref:Uncharacterized protein n=1 Tax=Daphnia galeata TaxID=27404 RepID=A0A8J2RUH5_9CRUS|nr:unnamed protein product [Daphnia galeata]
MFQTDGVNPSSATNSNSRRCCRVKKTTSLDNISNGLLLLLVSHFTCQRRRRSHRCQSATTRNLLLFSWTAAVAVWLFSATPAFAVAKDSERAEREAVAYAARVTFYIFIVSSSAFAL